MPEKFDFSKIEDQKKAEALPKEERNRIEDEAHDEANLMMEKVKSGEADNYGKSEKIVEQEKKEPEIETVEKELSPEVIEKIMDKVQDINLPGTAFHNTAYKNAESVFSNGLIGSDENDKKKEPKKDWGHAVNAEWWRMTAKRRKKSICFSVMGENERERKHLIERLSQNKKDDDRDYLERQLELCSQDEPMNDTSWFCMVKGFAIIFDISSFKKVDDLSYTDTGKMADRKFRHRSYKDYGWQFEMSSRVAPRFFKGIAIPVRDFGSDEEREYHTDELVRFMKEVFSKKKLGNDLFIPIYDGLGNLRWPKKMSYEEVKKFVAERDKNKQEEEEKVE